MMTLNKLSNFMWYAQEMIILESDQTTSLDIEDLKSRALFAGDNMALRSDTYKELKNRYIQSFGTLDDYLIITLKK